MNWRAIGAYAAYVILWLTFSALCIWLVIELLELLNALAIYLVTLNPGDDTPLYLVANQLEAFSKCIAIPAGILGIVGVVWLEEYLRHGVSRNTLWQRALRVVVVLGSLTGVIEGSLFLLG